MSSKSKLIIGIVMLALGAGLIPTGLLTNDYLRDEVYDGVPRALRTIRDDGVEGLMPQIPVLSTPDVLKGIYDTAIDELEDFVLLDQTANILRIIKTAFLYQTAPWMYHPVDNPSAFLYYGWDYMIHCAAAAKLMSTTVSAVGSEAFFNDNNTLVYAFLPGVSTVVYGPPNYWGVNMSYGFHSQNVILNYGMSDPYIPDVSGWLEDTDMGSGLGQFNARYEGTDPYTNGALKDDYFVDDTELYALYLYTSAMIYYYAGVGFGVAYPGEIYANATNPFVAFYQQWANATYISNGIDLNQFFAYSWAEISDPGLMGIEAGVSMPTNISLANSVALWDSADNRSFDHDDGFKEWMNAAAEAAIGNFIPAATLMGYFSITQSQFSLIASWLNNFMTDVTPVFLEFFGIDVTSTATGLFHEQWANGTIQGNVELSDGFLNELDPSLGGAPYFEIGLPIESNISLAKTMNLWNVMSDKTFLFSESFQSIWLPALLEGNTTSQAFIMLEFGLGPTELAAVLGWLGALIGLDPTTGRIAQIIEVEKGAPLATIVLFAVYEQWANGTINGEVVIPDGLLSRRSPPIYGPPYFELGLMYPIGLTVAQTMALWNEASEYSLVTGSGINKWYGAAPGTTTYDNLKTQNGGLEDWQMAGILAWLPVFRDVITNKLGEDDKNLPMTPYALGETLVLSLGIGGGALAALGVVMLILSRRS